MKKLISFFVAVALIAGMVTFGSLPAAAAEDDEGTYVSFGVWYDQYGKMIRSDNVYMDSVIVLNKDGKGTWEMNGEKTQITEWKASNGELSLTGENGTVTGGIKDGIITLEMYTGMTLYLAKTGADTSAYQPITMEEFLAATEAEASSQTESGTEEKKDSSSENKETSQKDTSEKESSEKNTSEKDTSSEKESSEKKETEQPEEKVGQLPSVSKNGTYTVTSAMKLRKEPKMSSEGLVKLEKGDAVEILEFGNEGFWKASFDGKEGYVLPSCLAAAEGAKTPVASGTKRVVSGVMTARLLKTPDNEGKILKQIPVNTKVEYYGLYGKKYYLISYDGVYGYLSSINTANQKMNENALAMSQGCSYFYGLDKDGFNKEKALECFQKAADAGIADAWLYIGRLAAKSADDDRYAKMAEYLDKGIAGGSDLCRLKKAEMLANGWGMEADPAEAEKIYNEVLEGGNPAAYRYLGLLYEDGLGREADAEKALEYYKKGLGCEDYGILNSTRCCIGNIYFSALAEPDYEKALSWYMKGAEEKYAAAIYDAARLYRGGMGVETDYAKAMEMLRDSAKRGDGASYHVIGLMYEYGEGVDVNMDEAFKNYKMGAEFGESYAMASLGNCYYYGSGTGQNYEEALKWYTKAANDGYAYGAYRAGIQYFNGEGTGGEDYSQAFSWFEKGAKGGDYRAQVWLGYMYHKGYGTEQNDDKAVEWLEKGKEGAQKAGNQDMVDDAAGILLEIQG